MNVLYEDDDLLFVNKPPDIVVQRGYAEEPVFYDHAVQYLAPKNEIAFLMQRLDRGTSGVMFFSKKSDINANLTRQFERKEIRKHYVALVHGLISTPQTIAAPLARIGPISFGVRTEGKRAVTVLTPRATGRDCSLVDIGLLTGRTHQIRVHLASIVHPLVGDWLYGDRDAARPMLHSARLEMTHPRTRVRLEISAPISQDFVDECTRRGISL